MDLIAALVVPVLVLLALFFLIFVLTTYLHPSRRHRQRSKIQSQFRPLSLGQVPAAEKHERFVARLTTPLVSVQILQEPVPVYCKPGANSSPQWRAVQRPVDHASHKNAPPRLPLSINICDGSALVPSRPTSSSPKEGGESNNAPPVKVKVEINKPLPALPSTQTEALFPSPRLQPFEAFLFDTIQRRAEIEERKRQNARILSKHPSTPLPNDTALGLDDPRYGEIELALVQAERNLTQSKLEGAVGQQSAKCAGNPS